MTQSIPKAYQSLLKSKSFAHLATTMADGTPQVTPVWIDYDGEYVLVNSAAGRLKDRNMRARPYVALSVLDPENPYAFLAVRGPVVEIIEGEAARKHIDSLAQRYLGREAYNGPPGETRCLYKIAPEHVLASGR